MDQETSPHEETIPEPLKTSQNRPSTIKRSGAEPKPKRKPIWPWIIFLIVSIYFFWIYPIGRPPSEVKVIYTDSIPEVSQGGLGNPKIVPTGIVGAPLKVARKGTSDSEKMDSRP